MLMNSSEYIQTVEHIKNEITSAQYRAMQKVNSELVILYYNIGKVINEHKSWGNKFIDNLAKDITIKKMSPASIGGVHFYNSVGVQSPTELCRHCVPVA
jgi:hypothetical protein